MFDPTAYENMRVVIDGFFYDYDLEGKISIIDRNDLVNMAKLSREYSLQFHLKDSYKKYLATFRLDAGIENLAAELLPLNLTPSRAGCFAQLEFIVYHSNEADIFNKIHDKLLETWGESRTFTQQVRFNPFEKGHRIENCITIEFNRMISEDQIDDLVVIGEHMIVTLKWLENHI